VPVESDEVPRRGKGKRRRRNKRRRKGNQSQAVKKDTDFLPMHPTDKVELFEKFGINEPNKRGEIADTVK